MYRELKINSASSYKEHLNKHDVIMLNIQEICSKTNVIEDMLDLMQKRIIKELQMTYHLEGMDLEHLDWAMQDIYNVTDRSFIILIDEWDCFFRECQHDIESQKKYLDFLRTWLKDREYVGLVYMTGILPIKKYGSHSALNMYSEYSMTNPGGLDEFFGFTGLEVAKLCHQHGMSFEETKVWYDGYTLGNEQTVISIYNPKSVVEAMLHHSFRNYWNMTETYEALKKYIKMNFDGVKDAIITMLAGGRIEINPGKFKNDMISVSGKNDVLTLLVHLGYLTFDLESRTVAIPNKEVSEEYMNAIEDIGWDEVLHS